MLKNNNLKICRKLVRRDFQFHKGRNVLLTAAITLVCALCTFSFSLGDMIQDGYLYNYQIAYGSTSHILYYGLTNRQADALSEHADVKSAVRLAAIGVLSDDMMEYRSVKLAAADPQWAESVEALPTEGRMPQADDEIALDELTLNSLAIPHELGAEVVIRWTPADGSPERTDTFRLCGWWSSVMGYTETCAWITPAAAKALCPTVPDIVTLGVTLHQPDDLETQAVGLLSDLGLGEVAFTTNLAYNDLRADYAESEARPYYLINLVVALCGILMVYNIVRISTQQNVRFYGRVKSLGMTPRQIRRIVQERVSALCLIAVPLGWLLGFGIQLVIAPVVVIGMGDEHPALFFFSVWPFAASAILTWATTLIASALPARLVTKITPAEAMRYAEIKVPERSRRRSRRRTSNLRMALSELCRNKGRTLVAAASLFVALSLISSSWTQYISYDQEKYISGLAVNDYHIADASAIVPYQRYNPWSHSITPEMVEELAAHPAVTELGVIRTMEVSMSASEEERAPIVDSFEWVDESGQPRKSVMEGQPDWMTGYEKLRETGEYIGIVTGISGEIIAEALALDDCIEGSFDSGLFETGHYVVAAGADTPDFLTTPPVGSKVIIGGQEFEIMAAIPAPSILISGGNSREAAFNVSYFMPEQYFDQLFPDSGIRDVVINIDHSRQTEFESFLEDLLADSYASVTTRSYYQLNFENARFHTQMIPIMVGIVLLIIGFLNFCNALVTKTLVRKKEFAVYESLGMTHKQLKRLMLTEGIVYAVILLLLLIPSVAAVTWSYTKWWLAHTNTWCVTYQYSLLPLWLTMPVLLLLAIAIPLICLRFLTQESVTERLRIVD